MVSEKNKVRLVSNCDVVPDKVENAQVNGVSIPGARQPDLLYVTSVLVSSGPNLNGAFFMPSELVSARDSIVNKAADVLHEEQEVVGHVLDRAFVTKEGTAFDALGMMQAKGELFNKESFNIATLSVVYKLRFPEVAQDILNGRFKVSMECFYEDFDIMLPGSDFILSADEAVKNGLVELIGKQVKVVDGNERQVDKVFRVLRNMVFSGFGFVDNPANPESIIMETADLNENELPVIDLNKIESYRKAKQEKTRIELSSSEEEVSEEEEEGGEEGKEIGTNFVAPTSSTHDSLCVSFKRYVHAGNPQAGITEVTRENYCALFDNDCPTAGSSTDVGCWRNVLNRTVREELTSVLAKLHNTRVRVSFESRGEPIPDGFLLDETPTLHDTITPMDLNEIVKTMEVESKFTREFDTRTLAKSLRDIEVAIEEADVYLKKTLEQRVSG